jgi:Tfp pilus assembly protein PilO
MKNPAGRKQLLSMALGLAAFCGAYGYFIFRPVQRSLIDLKSELAATQARIALSDQQRPIIEQLQTELVATRSYSANWEKTAPRRNRVVDVYSSINDLAKQAGISIERFSPLKDQEGKVVCLCPVNLSVAGDFDRVFTFLRQLDELSTTVWTTEVTLRQNRESGDTVAADIYVLIVADNREISG